jgi:hypothetical protein
MGNTPSRSQGGAVMSGNGAENIQEPPQKQTSPSLATPVVVPAILLTTGIVGGILVLTVPFVILPLCGHSLPFMATPAVKVKKALQFIQKRHQQRQQTQKLLVGPAKKAMDHAQSESATIARRRMFLDLGSGDGEAVWQAAQMHSSDGDGDGDENNRHASSVQRQEEHNQYGLRRCRTQLDVVLGVGAATCLVLVASCTSTKSLLLSRRVGTAATLGARGGYHFSLWHSVAHATVESRHGSHLADTARDVYSFVSLSLASERWNLQECKRN